MTSGQRTAIVVIVAVTSVAITPIRAAEDVCVGAVETNVTVESAAASTTGEVRVAGELGGGVALVAVDPIRGQLSTVRQLQPTKLKKVSHKKAIIILAVVVTAAVLITYMVAVAGFHPVFSSLNETGHVPAQRDRLPVTTQPTTPP